MVLPSSEMGSRLKNKVRLAYLVSHPIQYQAPLLRRIAQEPDIDLTVFFGSDFSVRDYKDAGFGVGVKWDVPLLDGYRHEFLPVLRDSSNPGALVLLGECDAGDAGGEGIGHTGAGPGGAMAWRS